ncbi:MAG TPA: hypothetical protein VHO68_10745 [Bacteroidales bacterium]|jgi:hypothetical protein|nr:hypothetical protein [Bacteroidales bacterium]
MKRFYFPLLTLIALLLPACDFLGGVFKTGMGVGAIAVVVIIVLIIFIVRSFRGRT